METDKLRHFKVIAETGSLTKAAGILGVSHSGLSKSMTTLERVTKLKLFRPLGRGLEITSEGKWFYQKAQEILKIEDEMLKEQRASYRHIRVGLSGVIVVTCSGAMAAEFEEPMILSEVDVGEIEGKIVGGELDFGIAFVPAPKPELEYLEIGDVEFSSYARADLLKNKQVVPFAVPSSDFPMNPLGYKHRDGWPGLTPRTLKYFVSDFAIALDLLRAGQAAVYMPDFVASIENNLSDKNKIVEISTFRSSRTKRKLFLVKRDSADESKEMKKIVKIIRRICCKKI